MNEPILDRCRVADMLCGALEGGSNYWYYLPDLKEVYSYTKSMTKSPLVDRIINAVYDNKVSVDVYDIEEPETKLGSFNLETIAKGEELMKANQPEHFENIVNEEDDAETADVWFQFVVMGEIVFG